ncbi:MAG: DUF4921 family protein [Planctomycetota bacterium]|nr:DUF4921 family protein [Planctomycetota bacterium]
MNEMRYDWLGDRWVLFAPNRILRPDNYRDPSKPFPHPASLAIADRNTDEQCPFCSGHEQQTPPPTLVLKTHSSHDWSVRVVPNKFPAIDPANAMPIGNTFPCASADNSELFLRKQTRGGHEVIIEAPDHIHSITQLQADHAALIFEAYQRRLRYWRSVQAMRYAVVFKNNGADAGASLVHTHSQLICTDFLPTDVLKTQLRASEYFQTHSRCYACDVLEKEIQSAQRIVAQTESFVALCPFASRLPYCVSILPVEHQSAFEECTPGQLVELARLVQWTLRSIECEHPQVAYNYVLQTAPLDAHNPAAFHWRLKILPRLTKVAGFEWSSECYINTVLPEDAAKALGRHIPTGLSEKSLSRTAITQP